MSHNPQADHDDTDTPAEQPLRYRFGQRAMRYPNAYVWLLFFAAMDIMLTWLILYLGGREVNPIAEKIIFRWELNGMIIYKFALITVFIVICEIVGSMRDSTGWWLSRVSVVIAASPVCWSLFLLIRHGAF